MILSMLSMQSVFTANAQELSKSEVRLLTREISKTLDENYIIPGIKEKLVSGINENLKNGKYDSISNPSIFAKLITEDMRDISNDLHLYLLKKNGASDTNSQPQRQMMSRNPDAQGFLNLLNFERLAGNIAYIEIPKFPALQDAKEEFDRVLKETVTADAIIFDVRNCRGGHPDAVAYIVGSFIEEPTHLTTYYSNEGALEHYSAKTAYGSANKDKEVYILSDTPNGSAGEGFAFYTQQIGRTTVVGQISKGAGRSNATFTLSNDFILSVSVRTSVTPNGKQFEGIGVQPDMYTIASQAKTQAHLAAIASLKQEFPDRSIEYNSIIKSISQSAELNVIGKITLEDKTAIESTVKGYIENFFENNAEEMSKYLHPDLAKGGVSKKRGEDILFFETMSMEKLNKIVTTKPVLSKSSQSNEIKILDVFRNTASVRLNTGYPQKMKWIEYILLTKIDGKWLINDIIWDYYPMQRRGSN